VFSTIKTAHFNHVSFNPKLSISCSNGSDQLCKALWRTAMKSTVLEIGIITCTNITWRLQNTHKKHLFASVDSNTAPSHTIFFKEEFQSI